ncbi:hypothetical protein Barb4_04232 [Bacteroidales bacterium Barb4]|nr:hypothetical protein Barb4_04232 [Bacteroidales bacterium Barb4]
MASADAVLREAWEKSYAYCDVASVQFRAWERDPSIELQCSTCAINYKCPIWARFSPTVSGQQSLF